MDTEWYNGNVHYCVIENLRYVSKYQIKDKSLSLDGMG